MTFRRKEDNTRQPPIDVSYDSDETGGCCPIFPKGSSKTRLRRPSLKPQKRPDPNTGISTKPVADMKEVESPVVSSDSDGDELLNSTISVEITSPMAVGSTPVKASSPEASTDKIPATRQKQRAQEQFMAATVKLEVARSKAITELQIPEASELQQFENMDDVLKMAKVLESVFDKIDNARAGKKENRSRFQQVKDTAQVWLNASASSLKTGLNMVQVRIPFNFISANHL